MTSKPTPERYEVVDLASGERFGNHTYSEAVARSRVMARNWQYKKQFAVEPRAALASVERRP